MNSPQSAVSAPSRVLLLGLAFHYVNHVESRLLFRSSNSSRYGLKVSDNRLGSLVGTGGDGPSFAVVARRHHMVISTQSGASRARRFHILRPGYVDHPT